MRRIGFDLGLDRPPRRGRAASPAGRAVPLRARPILPAATSAATRSTASRCAAWRPACEATGIDKIVIGVSGGLDSTHALIVAARAIDRLGLPRENVLAYTMPGFATSDHTLRQRAPADARARGQRLRARHPPGGHADAARPRPPRRRRRAGVRRHVRERAGRRAHLASVPARQLSRRAGARHRRPVRAGARVGDVRRRRPDVALPRQRLGPEDADPVPAPLGDRHRSVRRRGQRGARRGADTEISPELVPRHDAEHDAARQRQRERRRALRDPGLLPVLHRPLRLHAEQGRVSGGARLGRPRGRALARPDPGSSAGTSTRWPRSSTGSACSSSASSTPASSSARRCRTPRRSARAARCRPAGDWRAPSDGTATAWLAELRERVPDEL